MAFNNLGLQEPSTVTARVATVTIQRGSTLEHQEILVLGDATSSLAVAQVTNAAPSTSAYGLAVRQVDAVQSAQSGAWTVRATLSSTGTDNPVTAAQSGTWTVRANVSSTAADNPVTAAQAGTWNIGTVTAVTGKVSVVNSSAADLGVAISDGIGNALESSTQITSSNARGLIVRPVISLPKTYSASTTGQSSATTIFTSNATVRPYVFAYSITSTLNGPVYWSIQKGSTRLWGGVLAAISSAISGANLAVSPPGFLFAGSTGRPLSFNVESSNAGLNVSIAYWQCP